MEKEQRDKFSKLCDEINTLEAQLSFIQNSDISLLVMGQSTEWYSTNQTWGVSETKLKMALRDFAIQEKIAQIEDTKTKLQVLVIP
jgi:hypothetical protein